MTENDWQGAYVRERKSKVPKVGRNEVCSRGIARKGESAMTKGLSGDNIVEPSAQRWHLTLWGSKRQPTRVWGAGMGRLGAQRNTPFGSLAGQS